MRQILVLVVVAIISTSVLAEDIHYCADKSGHKVISDKPCASMGLETKSVRSADTYRPLSVTGGLTDGERRLAEQYRQAESADEARRQQQAALQQSRRQSEAQVQAQANAQACAALEQEKSNVVAQQRTLSTPYLAERFRAINDEIYRRRCGS